MGRIPRVRTVSLNCFMGSPIKVPHARTYLRTADITSPAPSDALVFIEERADTINDASFAMEWSFDPDHPGSWVLRDKPAASHRGGANLTYADGHVEPRHWQDARTRNPPRNDAEMPGNRDVLWLQEHGTWRKPKGADHAN
jgi:prepilin-type processing-associated H-X9-DG protein